MAVISRPLAAARVPAPDLASILRSASLRFGWVANPLALAGVLVAAGQVLTWSLMGAWPFHDAAAFWLSGAHFREGLNPYAGDPNYMTMLYSPPWVLLMSLASLAPVTVLELVLLVGQIVALRSIAGSWRAFGLLCWLPFTPREFAAGNMDFIIGAAILGAVRGRTTVPAVLFAFAKFAPALALLGPGSRRREALIGAAVLIAITLPWPVLWPQWLDVMLRAQAQVGVVLPILPRIPIVIILLAIRRPWSIAAAAGLATPGFYVHSFVMLYPALMLLVSDVVGSRAPEQALQPRRDGHLVPAQVVG